MSKIAIKLVSWYDWLSQPPMCERERIHRQIAVSHNDVRIHTSGH